MANLSHAQRYSITPDSPNNSYEKLANMNDCDQIDWIIMKYVFRRADLDYESNQLSLMSSINHAMIYEEMPTIQYELVE